MNTPIKFLKYMRFVAQWINTRVYLHIKILMAAKLLYALLLTLYCTGFAQNNLNTPTENPLTIEDIECPSTPPKLCQKMLDAYQIEVGQVVDDKKINAMKMAHLSIYSSMNVYLKKGQEKNHVILVVDLEHEKTFTTEINAGTLYLNKKLNQRLGTRLIKQNLFGKGKIATLEVDGNTSLENNHYRYAYSRLQYIDPYLFNRKDYFLFTGLSLTYGKLDRDLDRFKWHSLGTDFYLGKRLNKKSFITLGYTYAPLSKTKRITPTGIESYGANHRISFSFGWDRRNDVYFPTRGSQFNTGITWMIRGKNSAFSANEYDLPLDYSVYWSKNNKTIWSFIIGSNPGNAFSPTLEENMPISFGIARDITSATKKMRLYLDAGMSDLEINAVDTSNIGVGLKAGLKIKSKNIGFINLYLLGTHEWEF